jgi:hypothetical protein
MGPGVLLSIAMGAGFGGGNGSGKRRSIVCPCDIGIGMGLSIRRNFGMIAFMGSIDVDGNGWDGEVVKGKCGRWRVIYMMLCF